MGGYRPAKKPRGRKKSNNVRKEQPVSAFVLVDSIVRPVKDPRVKAAGASSKAEMLLEFDGYLIGNGEPMLVHMRIVRANWAKKLASITPGTTLKVEGHLKRFMGNLELRIVRGEVVYQSTFVDGYKPSLRADGTWRWGERTTESAPERTQPSSAQGRTFVWH